MSWLSNVVVCLEDHHQAFGHIASFDEDHKDSMSIAHRASESHWRPRTLPRKHPRTLPHKFPRKFWSQNFTTCFLDGFLACFLASFLADFLASFLENDWLSEPDATRQFSKVLSRC